MFMHTNVFTVWDWNPIPLVAVAVFIIAEPNRSSNYRIKNKSCSTKINITAVKVILNFLPAALELPTVTKYFNYIT